MFTFVVSDGNVAVGKKWEIMTKEEYKKKLRALEVGFSAIQYSPYEIGDIIEDHYHIIEIQRIGLPYFEPNYFYRGIELKKDLTPKIRQSNTHMWIDDIERKLKR